MLAAPPSRRSVLNVPPDPIRSAPHPSGRALPLALAFVASCGAGDVETDAGVAVVSGGHGSDFVLPFEPEDDPRVDTMGRAVADVALTGPGGATEWLLAGRDEPLIVVAFTQVGCPIAMRYGPALAELHAQFAARGVAFVGVDGSPQDSFAEVERQRVELELPFAFLKDERQQLVRALDVRTSTEVLVLDAERRLCYRGAIDERFEVGVVRASEGRELLRDALDALLAGRAPAVQLTRAPGCLLTRREPQAATALPDEVRYHEHVAPILDAHCVGCHRPGQSGPFRLDRYGDAAGWANMIDFVVSEGIMPPWPVPAPFDGAFANERVLSDRDRALLARWVATGAAEGDPDAAVPPRARRDGWQLDRIDLILEADRRLVFRERGRSRLEPLPAAGYAVPREGPIEYQNFVASHVFEEDTWIDGIEVAPTASAVVHHIAVFTADAERLERGRGRGARPRRAAEAERDDDEDPLAQLGASYFGLYTPGATPVEYPAGYARLIPAGSTIRFQVHYTADGRRHTDRPRVALRFATALPAFEVRTGSVQNPSIVLAPHEADREFRASRAIPADAILLTVTPHMHYRGKHFRFFLESPSGQVRSLVSLPWSFDWQAEYRLREPIPMPAGSALRCVGLFDNSAANPWNPDPDATVWFGRRTVDEMFYGYFDFAIPVDPGDPADSP